MPLQQDFEDALARLREKVSSYTDFVARRELLRRRIEARAPESPGTLGPNSSPEERAAAAHEFVAMLKAGRASGALSAARYTFLVRNYLDLVRWDRLSEGAYDSELGPIAARLREVRADHGLSELEFWQVGEGPAEWTELQHRWDEAYRSSGACTTSCEWLQRRNCYQRSMFEGEPGLRPNFRRS